MRFSKVIRMKLSLKQNMHWFVEIPGLDFENTNNYNSLMQQTLEHVVRLKDIYVKYLKLTGNV